MKRHNKKTRMNLILVALVVFCSVSFLVFIVLYNLGSTEISILDEKAVYERCCDGKICFDVIYDEKRNECMKTTCGFIILTRKWCSWPANFSGNSTESISQTESNLTN